MYLLLRQNHPSEESASLLISLLPSIFTELKTELIANGSLPKRSSSIPNIGNKKKKCRNEREKVEVRQGIIPYFFTYSLEALKNTNGCTDLNDSTSSNENNSEETNRPIEIAIPKGEEGNFLKMVEIMLSAKLRTIYDTFLSTPYFEHARGLLFSV